MLLVLTSKRFDLSVSDAEVIKNLQLGRGGHSGLCGSVVESAALSQSHCSYGAPNDKQMEHKGDMDYDRHDGKETGIMSKSTRMLIALAMVASLALAVLPVFSSTWDLAGDYSTTNGNPNGQWSYGYTTAGPDLTTFTTFTTTGQWGDYTCLYGWFNTRGTGQWDAPNFYIAKNDCWIVGRPYSYVAWGKVGFRPYGAGSTENMAVVRFTPPSAGYYTFTGALLCDPGGWWHENSYGVVLNKTNYLCSGAISGGYYGSNTAPIFGTFNAGAGSTLDFVVGTDPNQGLELNVDATIKSGQWVVQGYVRDAGSNGIAGAQVEVVGGTQSTTTDSMGYYTLIVFDSAAHSIKASKLGYVSSTANGVVVDGSAPVTQNFALPLDVATFSGTVTENFPPAYPAITGATVASTDGIYNTTTDSAGHYSIDVTHASHTFTFYKLGHVAKPVTIDASAGNVTQNVKLDIGYDFATDFSSVSNPNGAWTYGYATGTAPYKQTPDSFKAMDRSNYPLAFTAQDRFWFKSGSDPLFYLWPGDDSPGWSRPVFEKNIVSAPRETLDFPYSWAYYGGPAYREPGKVIANESVYNLYTVARLKAPTSGFFHISARFAGSSQVAPYTQSKVALMYGNEYIFGGPSDVKAISGFVGRAVNGYTDSAGTTPVYTYSFDKDVALGDEMDALVLNDASTITQYVTNGWTQVDVTLTKDATTLTGRVTSTLPGNPPICGATITANGEKEPWSTYQTLTDVNGYYVISVRPNTYDIEAKGPGFNTSPTVVKAVAQDGVVVTDFVLTHSGTWNLAADYSETINPNGQWTYGSYTATSDIMSDPTGFKFTPSTTFGTIWRQYEFTSSLKGWIQVRNPWSTSWIARNTTSAPVTWTVPSYTPSAYVEKNHLSFGGGGTSSGGDPGLAGDSAVRWTAPDARVISISLAISGQVPGGSTPSVTLFHNGVPQAERIADGYVGTSSAGYIDSVGPTPTATYGTSFPVAAGDTIDLVAGRTADIWLQWTPSFTYPSKSMDVSFTIGPGSGVAKTTIAGVKSLNQGDVVFMTTPLQLACATLNDASFDKSYGNPTPGSGFCFYLQSDDRAQGLKCISDGSIPSYNQNFKITFTGVVDVQQGQKVVRVQSINSAVLGTAPNPIGKTSKSLTNNGTLVKAWGKITQLVANSGSDNDQYTYEYMVINDGGQDIKIPMHVTYDGMASVDARIRGLAIGHYISVTGIAGTTTGSDVAVYPRYVYDIYDYTAQGRL